MLDDPPDEEADPPAPPVRSRAPLVPGWAVVAAALAALAAVALPPVAEDGLVALVDERPAGLDTMVTGTVAAPPQRRYTVHRSVLHPGGQPCTVFADGRAHGAC
jgi:hypothetical protein